MVDSETSASIAAVAIAAVAFCVALSQVVQQYASSGQLIRLCDSVVYGGSTGLPGRGRRLYQLAQFRFRIVYDVPVFSLPPLQSDLVWNALPVSANSPGVDAAENERLLANLSPSPRVGEASWVSFCRKAKSPCYDHFVVSLIEADADRCPPDLPNIAVPVSLRDVAIMAFAMDMECTEASFARKTMSMQGSAGSLGSAHHPVLGTLLHFIPRSTTEAHARPSSWKQWVARLFGLVPLGLAVLPHGGKQGRFYYESDDKLLEELRAMLLSNGELPDGLAEVVKNPWTAARDNEKASFSEADSTFPAPATLLPADDGGTGNEIISWYWMSQMNVFQGAWATPWKRSVDASFCIIAYSLIQSLVESHIADQIEQVQHYEIRRLFEYGVPFQSAPPFAVPFATDQLHPGIGDATWKYCDMFEAKLPPLVLLTWSSMTLREDRRMILSNHGAIPSSAIVLGTMKLDQWLTCAAGTNPVLGSKTQILRKIPAIVEFVLDYSAVRYRAARELRLVEVRRLLEHTGLSQAERVYSMVALLRTLLVAACIGVGQDTRLALEILDNDLPVHFV